MKIYNLGSLNIDYVYAVEHFVRAGETISSENMHTFAGGKGLNQSIAAAKAGGTVIHGGLIGEEGKFLLDALEENQVDISRIKTLDCRCGHTIIQIDKSGQNCIVLFGGANRSITKEYIDFFLRDAQCSDILLLQNEVNCLNEAFEAAISKKMQIAFNPSPFDKSILSLPLNKVDWWFCNEIEGNELSNETEPQKIADKILSLYPQSHLILTLGSKGCIYKDKSTTIKQPVFDAEVVDTTAAGDTFTGYFLTAMSQGKSIEQVLRIATAASAIAISRNGASPSIPAINEVNAFLDSQSI